MERNLLHWVHGEALSRAANPLKPWENDEYPWVIFWEEVFIRFAKGCVHAHTNTQLRRTAKPHTSKQSESSEWRHRKETVYPWAGILRGFFEYILFKDLWSLKSISLYLPPSPHPHGVRDPGLPVGSLPPLYFNVILDCNCVLMCCSCLDLWLRFQDHWRCKLESNLLDSYFIRQISLGWKSCEPGLHWVA